MPFYILEYDGVDDYVERRAPFRDDHLKLVRAAHARGEVLMAGAVGDPPSGAMFVFAAVTADPAEAFAKADPYVLNGVIAAWSIRPWHVVVGDEP